MAVVLASGRKVISVDADLRQRTVLELRAAAAQSLGLDEERVLLLLGPEVLEDGDRVEDVLLRAAQESGAEDASLTAVLLDNGVDEPLDPQGSELWGEICRRQRAAEERHMVAPDVLDKHPDLTFLMFGILLDWLFTVCRSYRFSRRTVMLAHSVLVRFLGQSPPILRADLQLCGVVAILVASKYEEANKAMTVDTAVFICANAYDAARVRTMERVMLSAIDFALEVPTAEHFKERFLRANKSDATKSRLAACVIDLALQEASLLATRPSLLAAAAVLLSNRLQPREDVGPWSRGLVNVTSYKEADLAACADALQVLLLSAKNSNLGEVRTQYPDVMARVVRRS